MITDNGIFDTPDPQPHLHDFAVPMASAALGAYLGHRLDQTRFGICFNENRIIHSLYIGIGRFVAVAVVCSMILFAAILLTG